MSWQITKLYVTDSGSFALEVTNVSGMTLSPTDFVMVFSTAVNVQRWITSLATPLRICSRLIRPK